jgi:hypothetical protein
MLFQMKQYNFLSTQRPVSSRVNSKLQHVKNYLNSNLIKQLHATKSNLIFDDITLHKMVRKMEEIDLWLERAYALSVFVYLYI